MQRSDADAPLQVPARPGRGSAVTSRNAAGPDRSSRQAALVGLVCGPGSIVILCAIVLAVGLCRRMNWQVDDDSGRELAGLALFAMAFLHCISAVAVVHTIVDRWKSPRVSWMVMTLWIYWILLVVWNAQSA